MKKHLIKILIVEAESSQAEAICRSLDTRLHTYQRQVVATLQAARQAISQDQPDLILANFKLADGLATDLLSGLACPLVVMTSREAEPLGAEAIRAGAMDAVVKSPEAFAEINHTIEHALRDWTHILESRQAKKEILQNTAHLSALFENTDDFIWVVDEAYRLVKANSRYYEVLGPQLKKKIGHGASLLLDSLPREQRDEWRGYYDRALRGETFNIEIKNIYTVEPHLIEYRFHPVRLESGSISGVVVSGRDITARQQTEQALHEKVLEFELLAQAANAYLDLKTPGDIYRYIGPLLKQISGADYVVITAFDPTRKLIYTEYFYGIEALREKFQKVLGIDPQQITFPAERIQAMIEANLSEGKLGRIKKGLYDIMLGEIPEPVCLVVEKLLGVTSIYMMAFMWQGQLFGTVMLGITGSKEVQNVRLVEVLTIHAANALQRVYAVIEQRESEKTYHTIIDHSPLAILLARDGKYIYANPTALRSLGYSQASDLIGQSIWSTIDPADAPLIQSWLMNNQEGNANPPIELTVIRADGSRYLSQSLSVPIRLPDGPAMLSMGFDITSRKQAEAEIHNLNTQLEQRVIERTAQLEAANRELEAFAYSVSHDLRAPLRGINGFSEALIEDYNDQLDDQGRHYIQRIRLATQQMGHLIDDLLRLSRVLRAELKVTPVNLSELAETIINELQTAQPEREVQFQVTPGLTTQADLNLVRIVLDNLLRNSWKFTSRHPLALIEFGSIQLAKETAFFIRDDGAGFNQANSKKLFGAFQRLHSPVEFEGTGIGLALVQRIVQRHGGRVWAEGAVEKGATFYFTLGSMDTALL